MKYTFKSHNEVYDFCNLLTKNKEIVCQTIKDIVEYGINFVYTFNLEHDWIFQETDELDDNYGLWKVGRGRDFNI